MWLVLILILIPILLFLIQYDLYAYVSFFRRQWYVWYMAFSLLLSLFWWLPILTSVIFFEITGNLNFGAYYWGAALSMLISSLLQIILFFCLRRELYQARHLLTGALALILICLSLTLLMQLKQINRQADRILARDKTIGQQWGAAYIDLNRPKGNWRLQSQMLPYWLFIAGSDLKTLESWLDENDQLSPVTIRQPLSKDAGLNLKIVLAKFTEQDG